MSQESQEGPLSPTNPAVAEWRGRDAVDGDGDKVGTIDEIYVDVETGEPERLAVKTGMFGSKVSFIPFAGASDLDGDVLLIYDKRQISRTPRAPRRMAKPSQDQEAGLYRHYGVDFWKPLLGTEVCPVARVRKAARP